MITKKSDNTAKKSAPVELRLRMTQLGQGHIHTTISPEAINCNPHLKNGDLQMGNRMGQF